TRRWTSRCSRTWRGENSEPDAPPRGRHLPPPSLRRVGASGLPNVGATPVDAEVPGGSAGLRAEAGQAHERAGGQVPALGLPHEHAQRRGLEGEPEESGEAPPASRASSAPSANAGQPQEGAVPC